MSRLRSGNMRCFREIKSLAERYGFTLDRVTQKGHFMWRHPAGHVVVTGSDLKGYAPLKNAEENFRVATRQ